MFDLHKTFLDSQIVGVLSHTRELQWLAERDVQAERVANFGCYIGRETLALMWMLGANEAVGIDKDEGAIRQARDTLTGIQDEIKRIRRMVQHYPTETSEDDKAWWYNSVPAFFKERLLQSNRITFLVADITRSIRLPSDHYDVSYCDFVLHHIWYDSEREDAEGDTAFAVKEMARVTRPGGIVAASELVQYSDRRRLDFQPLFKEANLELLCTEETETDAPEQKGVVAKYLCKKPLPSES